MTRRKHEHAPKRTGPEGAWLSITGTAEIREICECGADRFIDESTRQPLTAWQDPQHYTGD